MKFSAKQIDEVQRQTGADPIPDDHPVMDQLKSYFGDHTFYVDQTGLHIWENLGGDSEEEEEQVTAVTVASWTDEEKTSLRPHGPKPTAVVVKLHPGTPEGE
jgi:hypothetical protein